MRKRNRAFVLFALLVATLCTKNVLALTLEQQAKEQGCVNQPMRLKASDMYKCSNRSGDHVYFNFLDISPPHSNTRPTPTAQTSTKLKCEGPIRGSNLDGSASDQFFLEDHFEVVFDDTTHNVSLNNEKFGKVIVFDKYKINVRRLQKLKANPRIETEYSLVIDRVTGSFEYQTQTHLNGARISPEQWRAHPGIPDFRMVGTCTQLAAKF